MHLLYSFKDNISSFRYSITTIFFVVYMNTWFISGRFESLLKILTGKNYRNNLIHEFVKTKSRLFFTPPIKVSYFNWACIYFNYEYRCLNNMIHWIDRKWTVVSFSKFYGETFVGSCHKAGNTYSQIYSLICTF